MDPFWKLLKGLALTVGLLLIVVGVSGLILYYNQ